MLQWDEVGKRKDENTFKSPCFGRFPHTIHCLPKKRGEEGGNGISRYNDYLSFNVEKETERCKNILPHSAANSEAPIAGV